MQPTETVMFTIAVKMCVCVCVSLSDAGFILIMVNKCQQENSFTSDTQVVCLKQAAFVATRTQANC
jgi:hypothetical protein